MLDVPQLALEIGLYDELLAAPPEGDGTLTSRLAPWLRVYREPSAELTQLAVGVDWVWLEWQHSCQDADSVRAQVAAIVCAGAVRSPQLLMLSGVGPAEALRTVGIPVVADRPGVGENLQDHVRVPVAYEHAGRRPTAPAALVRGAVQWALTRRGLFTSNVADAPAIVRLDPARAIPDLRLLHRWRVLPEHPTYLVDFEVVAIDPASRGRVTLASPDPTRPPRVDPGYLTAAADADVLSRGIELARAIAATASCRAAGVGAEVLPGATPALAHVRARASTAFHPVGTCRLGSDPGAVVEPWLRVVGVSGLRVVDASVMPTTVAGNAQAAVYAIAERAAELVRAAR